MCQSTRGVQVSWPPKDQDIVVSKTGCVLLGALSRSKPSTPSRRVDYSALDMELPVCDWNWDEVLRLPRVKGLGCRV